VPTGEPLASVSSLGPIRDAAGPPDDGTVYSEYVEITDDDNQIVVMVPVEWADVVSRNWVWDDSLIGPSRSASPDTAGYVTPGAHLVCSLPPRRFSRSRPSKNSSMTALVQLAATPENASYLIEGQFIAVTKRDWDAITEVVHSFKAE
jgi:hypothetical protein